MGVATSREFGAEIINSAEKGVSVERVLQNPKWKLAYKRLPPKSRRSIKKLTSTPKENCLSKLQEVQKSDIGVSKGLQPLFESWKNPERFFEYKTSVVTEADTVSQVYLELRRIINRHIDDPIRARIYAVALYDLRLLLDGDKSLQLRPEVKEKIQQVILDSPLVDDSPEDVSKWTRMFLKFGERMRAIAEGNGGLGALIVIPSSLLSLRQWATRLSDASVDQAIQHFQSIKVAQAARKAKANTVATRIHRLILQKFIDGPTEGISADYDEQMINAQEDEDDDENMEDDSTDDENNDNDSSSVNTQATDGNIMSRGTSVQPAGEAVHQELPAQVRVETRQYIAIEKQIHPAYLASTFNTQQTTGMSPPIILGQVAHKEAMNNTSSLNFLSEAADVVDHRNGQQTEAFNAVPPSQHFQRLPASLPKNYTSDQQQYNCRTELNHAPMNSGHDPLTPVTITGTAHDLSNSYTPVSRTLTGHNLWNSYIALDGTQINPLEDSIWDFYIALDGTQINPEMYNADLSY